MLPPDLASTIPWIRSDDGAPSAMRALFAAVDGQPRADMRPLRSASPDPPPPLAYDRRYAGRHCCHASAKDRRSRPQWSGEHGPDAAGRSRVDRPTLRPRKPFALCGQPAGHFCPASPDLRSRTRRTLKAYRLRSRAMASILTWASARPTRHFSMGPLGFVTLSPAGRPSNSYSQRFSPSPSANSSRDKIAGLRGPPLRSGPRKPWVQRRLSDGLFSRHRGEHG